MRVHPGVLLVVIALSLPFIVELRTMLVWVGIELTLVQSAAVGAVVIGAIVAWAVWPTAGNGTEAEASG